MDSQGFEGDDFFPSLEPMVIINSQDDEDDHVRLSFTARFCLNNACLAQSLAVYFFLKDRSPLKPHEK